MTKFNHMIKDIIQLGDSRLTDISEAIPVKEISSGWVQDLAKDLVDTCEFHVDSAAGLSAVQLGELKQIFVARRMDLEKGKKEVKKPVWEVMINPTIEVLDDSLSTEWEGCMSINSGKYRLFGPVDRPYMINIKYFDLNGVEQSLDAKGFFAHLIQHEMDHLNGKLFLSYVKNPKNIWKEDELDKYLDAHKAFPPIVQ